MLFTFLSAVHAFSGIVAIMPVYVYAYIYEQVPGTATDLLFGFASGLFKWNRMIDVFCGLIHVYAFTLAYKSKWKAFESVLYALLAIVVYNSYSVYCSMKENYMTVHNKDGSHTEKFGAMDDNQKETINKWLPTVLAVIILILDVIPLLVQMYLVKQTRSYIKYVLDKKDEKHIPSPPST
ncbi:hypothetical protein BCR42DRAFT_414532 [Absidia repens]|uniref:Uncharacterized protein n=1 Tax=Absidia repens TaxID=90262 RepID=A0A1X2IJ86_9FUNG|nr:hypothetical protein BCR42DRAFT_414532 [Absidia repens]